ncbi:MAG TPA: SGNH/GDSL hydrolase family protein [Candidatus Manganitrophaceae bacterium]|nr:SGNH/GDSL hydrolase family protein [Candidatus Manganitrophaceae bacterium]
MKIIAFGDSLTVGYQYPDPPAPYAFFLTPLLPGDTAISVAAVSGETTSDMLRRFDRDVLQNRPDWVIILGGTNDLGWSLPADPILKNLTQMYRMALAAKIAPVTCAVPSLLGADDFIPPRVALNRKIEQEANALQIPFVDFFKATCDPGGRLLEKYASDGLHLNARGYEKMARAVHETLFKK